MRPRLHLALGVALLTASGVACRTKPKAAAKDAASKPVRVITAAAKPFQPSHTYVGTLDPWVSAKVGPQLVSAYIDSVEVRPGAVVKRGDVLATLDCRDASAESRAAAMEAHAVAAHQKALAAEAARLQDLLAKHFVSPNEAEMKAAASAAEDAKRAAQEATLSRKSLEVTDCLLRAPFDGEVATRSMDPGAFVRPGMPIVTVVDRSVVRLSLDVPEVDFEVVPPGKSVRITMPATRQELVAVVSRRAPAADPSTRTVHVEIDVADPERRIPVGTTGEARVDVGPAEPATAIPLAAASVRGSKATVFVVEGGVAHARSLRVKGEAGGTLYLDPSLAAGASIVTEGRALLADGDRVNAVPEDVAHDPATTHAAKEQ